MSNMRPASSMTRYVTQRRLVFGSPVYQWVARESQSRPRYHVVNHVFEGPWEHRRKWRCYGCESSRYISWVQVKDVELINLPKLRTFLLYLYSKLTSGCTWNSRTRKVGDWRARWRWHHGQRLRLGWEWWREAYLWGPLGCGCALQGSLRVAPPTILLPGTCFRMRELARGISQTGRMMQSVDGHAGHLLVERDTSERDKLPRINDLHLPWTSEDIHWIVWCRQQWGDWGTLNITRC